MSFILHENETMTNLTRLRLTSSNLEMSEANLDDCCQAVILLISICLLCHSKTVVYLTNHCEHPCSIHECSPVGQLWLMPYYVVRLRSYSNRSNI